MDRSSVCMNALSYLTTLQSVYALSCLPFFKTSRLLSSFWLPAAPDCCDLWTLCPDLAGDNSPNKQPFCPVTW